MIPRSPIIAGLSVCVALAAHAAFLVERDDVTVEIEGGGNVAPAALGNSFADLVQGTASPVTADPSPQPRPADAAHQPVEVPADPTRANVADVSPASAQPPVAPPAATPVPTAVQPATPAAATTPVENRAALAPQSSPRPSTRPDPKPKVTHVEQPASAAPRGNGTRNARAGADTGAEDQSAAQATSARPGKATGAGNAAASNYPGRVMRQISRQRKPRTSVKGVAHVAFVIDPGGALASVGIAKSSGSAQLDALAVQQIRRAAPFPPPPAGARRQYEIGIKGS